MIIPTQPAHLPFHKYQFTFDCTTLFGASQEQYYVSEPFLIICAKRADMSEAAFTENMLDFRA
jgi:hypothetical protein